jgi:hypothetical protein
VLTLILARKIKGVRKYSRSCFYDEIICSGLSVGETNERSRTYFFWIEFEEKLHKLSPCLKLKYHFWIILADSLGHWVPKSCIKEQLERIVKMRIPGPFAVIHE